MRPPTDLAGTPLPTGPPAAFDVLAGLGAPAPPAMRATGRAGVPSRRLAHDVLIVDAEDDPHRLDAYRRLRRRAFVEQQGLFTGEDVDAYDAHPRSRVLVAVTPENVVLGGVRIHPEDGDGGLGWWRGSRLVCEDVPGTARGTIGAALVRAACVQALDVGALRFDAHVQLDHVAFFRRLGWVPLRRIQVAGREHVLMHWPVDRIARLVAATKAALGGLYEGLVPDDGWKGDDAVPVPDAPGVVACTDAITPWMVERDPEWAGWCAMLVTAHDLSAMGARPLGALDALGAADVGHATRVLSGVRRGAAAFDLPILGGHTQLGVPAALSVTGLGQATDPVPGAGRAGQTLTVTADLEGDWRPGYHGRQWDSTSWRRRDDLRTMLDAVRVARADGRVAAAKDVSMAGVVGTTGMLAEASGCGAELDVASIPRPAGASAGDWLTCFPGFALLTTDDRPDAAPLPAGPAVGAACGRLVDAPGVRLRWPDGEVTTAVDGAVTNLGAATRPAAASSPRSRSSSVPTASTTTTSSEDPR
ncbi:MAG: AIR synthase related protein [Patulibacter sp.]|nr:MSMEG_0567/sll0787 family protein [Patulibacter sp.]MDO9409335.1 AIR synthase related protein [Patulibacter sp.]